jgi:6-phosphogluconolactonase
MYAYVGSRTTRERNARGEGISVYRADEPGGALSLVQVVGDLVNPSYLALSNRGTHLYTVHGDQSDVSAFRVDRDTGALSFLNRQSTEGRNPVHLALAPDGRALIVTNHIGASVALLSIAADGSLGAVQQLLPFAGPLGPHRIEQQQAKPHFNLLDPSGRFVIVPDKGLDRVFGFRLQGSQLLPAASPFVQAREGAGPRSLVFHPSRPFAYVVNELDSTVTTYGFDAETGALMPLQIVPTLPSGFAGNSRAAGITIDATGHTLYASNRGHDSIAVFRVDARNGLLDFVTADSSGGRTPRFITLSPDGRVLYVLNEDSDTIVGFAVDAATGGLGAAGPAIACGSPVCMVFSNGRH